MANKKHVLPGFGISLGWSVTWVSLLVILPLAALAGKTAAGGWQHFWETVTDPEVVATYRVSFGISFIAALINGVFGFLAAWIFVRYEFPGRRILEAATDLPFALPTAVAGIALTALYSPHEWIGKWLEPHGIKVAFAPLGVLIAMIFIGFPFVVRAVQPVISDLSADVEEAAACLGASRWETIRRVILPPLLPAILTGVIMSYGRAVGEYGSIVFISGNIPFQTEITPLMIVQKLEQYDYTGAAALGFTMLAASLVIVLIGNRLQAWGNRFRKHA
ncbi:MAG: sulfate ABC transporter permease subunit CysT [Proteobacteria bacterium]|jgi:sulfate transport system permease protein|nr:sulfate ABC transporter permease subunit CysT [Pseudomonadota bacterium]